LIRYNVAANFKYDLDIFENIVECDLR